MKTLLLALTTMVLLVAAVPNATANYDRNQAVPVEKVLFGKVISVRNITRTELVKDRNNGWKTFGGALIGGAIGNQFGGGSGRDVATVLGAIIGASAANSRNPEYREISVRLVELMIKTDDGKEYMVVQDYDRQMIFHRQDMIRMIYLEGGTVRIDKQM